MIFNDGLDDDMIGDDEDRQKLASMTEAEREQEIFKRFCSLIIACNVVDYLCPILK